MADIVTGSSNTTYVVDRPCPPTDTACVIDQMHHYDDDGNHWCPTGFLWCYEHAELVGTIDGPGACALWGEKAG